MATKRTKSAERYAIIGHGPYGLSYGLVSASDEDIIRDKAVRVRECRNIRYWYGGKGGISSLSAWGPCGPRAQESRIGHPEPSTLILDVKAVRDCTPEAVAAFAAIVATR